MSSTVRTKTYCLHRPPPAPHRYLHVVILIIIFIIIITSITIMMALGSIIPLLNYGGIVKLTPPPPPHRLRLVLALLLLPLMLVLLLLLLLRLLLRQLLLLRRLLLLLLLLLTLLCASAAGSHVLRLLGGFLSSLTRMDKSISQGHPTAASVCIMSVVKLLRDAFGLGPQNAPSGSRPTRHCFVLLTVPVTLPVYSWQYLNWHRAFKTTTTFVATLRSWHE